MLESQRVPRRLTALLISLALAATALIPFGGVTSAQPPAYYLEIVAPDNVVVGQSFTVRVLVKQSSNDRIVTDGCASSAPVKLEVFGDGWQDTARARVGIVRFSVTIDKAGSWRLDAVVPGDYTCKGGIQSDYHSLTAVPQLPSCPPTGTCDKTWNSSYSAAVLIAETGAFTPPPRWVDWDQNEDCGEQPLDPDRGVLVFDLDEKTPKKVVLALAPKAVTKGIGQLRVCWQGVDDEQGKVLKPCKKSDAPCVLFKRSTKRNGALVGVQAPEGDPRAYIH